jgi:hypothetical protein
LVFWWCPRGLAYSIRVFLVGVFFLLSLAD